MRTRLLSGAFRRMGTAVERSGESMVRSWSVGAPAGVALLAALLLTGCAPGEPGNDDAAAPPGPGSSGPAPTSSSEEGSAATTDEYVPASLEGPARNVPEPVLPALAKEESLEGAQAFLDYWSDAMWYAYQTGDTSYARDITSVSCEVCADELSEVNRVYQGGQWLTGGRQVLELQESTVSRAADGIYKPVVKYRNDHVRLVEKSGVVDRVPPDSKPLEPLLVYLNYAEDKWVYITMAPLSGS